MGIVLEVEVLVCKSSGAVDSGATGAITVEEVSALNHEIFDLH